MLGMFKHRSRQVHSMPNVAALAAEEPGGAENLRRNSVNLAMLAQGAEQAADQQPVPQGKKSEWNIGLRKHFRQAVDERNENYEDYKNQSKRTRFKWAIKNPLAWAFGRTKGNQEKTRQRAARRNFLASLDLDTLDPVAAEDSIDRSRVQGNLAERTRALEAALAPGAAGGAPMPAGYLAAHRGGALETAAARRERALTQQYLPNPDEREEENRWKWADRRGLGVTLSGIGGTVLTAGSAVPNMLKTWNDAEGMGATVADLADSLPGKLPDKVLEKLPIEDRIDDLKNLNGKISGFSEEHANTLGNISGGMNLAGGVVNIGSNAVGLYNDLAERKRLAEGGDRQAAMASIADAVGKGIGMANGVNSVVKGIGQLAGSSMAVSANVAGGLGVLAGGAQIVAGSIEADRARRVKNSTADARNYYEDRLKSLEERERAAGGSQTGMLTSGYREQLEDQIGFMRMGHNAARTDLTRAGWKIASGGLSAIGGAASMAGATVPGVVLGLAGTGAGIVGGLHADSKGKKLRKQEVDTTLDMEQQIDELIERSRRKDVLLPESQRLNLTRKEAKHMILQKAGYVSRSDAYVSLAKKREERMRKMLPTERDAMLRALRLDPEKATDEVVYQRLGLNREEAANIDRAILNQKKRRLVPSWRR